VAGRQQDIGVSKPIRRITDLALRLLRSIGNAWRHGEPSAVYGR
jgi:hypothetical protein